MTLYRAVETTGLSISKSRSNFVATKSQDWPFCAVAIAADRRHRCRRLCPVRRMQTSSPELASKIIVVIRIAERSRRVDLSFN